MADAPGRDVFEQFVAAVRQALAEHLGATGHALTVNEFAERYRIGPDRVRALIRAGKLRALNVAPTAAGKPRFVIPPDAVKEFERAHDAGPPPKAPKRRRRTGEVDFFPG